MTFDPPSILLPTTAPPPHRPPLAKRCRRLAAHLVPAFAVGLSWAVMGCGEGDQSRTRTGKDSGRPRREPAVKKKAGGAATGKDAAQPRREPAKTGKAGGAATGPQETQTTTAPKTFVHETANLATGRLKVEPRSMSVVGGSATIFRKLRWNDWGAKIASARGEVCTSLEQSCTPVTIRLSRPSRIGGRRIYTCLDSGQDSGREPPTCLPTPERVEDCGNATGVAAFQVSARAIMDCATAFAVIRAFQQAGFARASPSVMVSSVALSARPVWRTPRGGARRANRPSGSQRAGEIRAAPRRPACARRRAS